MAMQDNRAPEAVAGGASVVTTRLFGWLNVAILAAFLINNVLTNGAGWPGPALLTDATSVSAWLQLAIYLAAAAGAAWFVLTTPHTALRTDSDRLVAINNYIIRAAFWMVVLVGIADLIISFMRVEGLLEVVVGDDLASDLGRSQFRGPYVHVPLIVLSIVIAAFTRTLGFVWLALLIVVAELLIVFARFIYSYEQAFMADLVRFWYGALFLFASAYTLVEEGHVRVDVFYAGFKTSTQGMVNALGTLTMGIVLCWTILIIGMADRASVINSPVFNFEVTQAGFGLYVKYLMAAFLGIFAISMLIQFCGYLMSAVADWRGDPGHVEHEHALEA